MIALQLGQLDVSEGTAVHILFLGILIGGFLGILIGGLFARKPGNDCLHLTSGVQQQTRWKDSEIQVRKGGRGESPEPLAHCPSDGASEKPNAAASS
jgi:hypothetical protein